MVAQLITKLKTINKMDTKNKTSNDNFNATSHKTDVRRCSFQWYATEYLIDCLPQNRPLYKDSGLWQVRTDDMENVLIDQNCNETLRGFILRYLDWLDDIDKEAVNDIWLSLSNYDMLS